MFTLSLRKCSILILLSMGITAKPFLLLPYYAPIAPVYLPPPVPMGVPMPVMAPMPPPVASQIKICQPPTATTNPAIKFSVQTPTPPKCCCIQVLSPPLPPPPLLPLPLPPPPPPPPPPKYPSYRIPSRPIQRYPRYPSYSRPRYPSYSRYRRQPKRYKFDGSDSDSDSDTDSLEDRRYKRKRRRRIRKGISRRNLGRMNNQSRPEEYHPVLSYVSNNGDVKHMTDISKKNAEILLQKEINDKTRHTQRRRA